MKITGEKKLEEKQWNKNFVQVVSSTTLFLGSILTTSIAAFETAISTALFAISFFLTYSFNLNALEKHTAKLFSYSFHSFGIGVMMFFAFALKLPKIKYHSIIACLDYGIYLASASVSQVIVRRFFDKRANRSPNLVFQRILDLLGDFHSSLLNDLRLQFQRDFGSSRQILENTSIQSFLTEYPQHREFIENFSLQQIENQNYRQDLGKVLIDYLKYLRIIQTNTRNQNLVRLNATSDSETSYQNYLVEMFKASITEIHQTEELSNYLKDGENTFKDRVEMYDAGIFPPLQAYTQLKEVMSDETRCPENFENRQLLEYNERREKILRAKEQCQALSEEEFSNLKRKILQTSDFQIGGTTQATYNLITTLAADLDRGPLVTQSLLDLDGPQNENVITSQNLFEKAFQEAIETL